MSTQDRRPRIFRSALLSKTLTPAQKNFMIAVVMLGPEYVDGVRRHESKAMGPDGHFALHYDYIAKALGTTVDSVKSYRQECEKKGYLSEVHRATFGRPNTYHALIVRGAESAPLTLREVPTPYGSLTPVTWGENSTPLAYKTPAKGEQAPDPCVEPTASGQGKAQRRNTECADPDTNRLAACEWHPHVSCPSDCKNADLNRWLA